MVIWSDSNTALAEQLVDQIYAMLGKLVEQYHSKMSDDGFMLTFEPPYHVQPTGAIELRRQKRCLIASPYWALIVKCIGRNLQVYLLPSVELLTAQTESATRLRLSMETARNKRSIG